MAHFDDSVATDKPRRWKVSDTDGGLHGKAEMQEGGKRGGVEA